MQPQKATQPTRILVAEDDQFYSKIFKSKLTKEGFEVTVVANGEEAIAEATRQTPDLILLDLVMPTKDGFETLAELKADNKLSKIKVIVLSNLGQDSDIAKAKKLGADDYFIKSNVSLAEMVEIVKKHL